MVCFDPTTEDEILKIIKGSASKTCSLDPIPTWFLKENIQDLLPIITEIVNSSLSSGILPSTARTAVIRPLLKKPSLDKNCLSNYRPVANLSFLGKIIEKVVCRQLMDHMTENDLYEQYQSAYRPLHSTETALVKVKNDIMFALDKGHVHVALLLSLDLSAAFDTIDRQILISRMSSRMGVDGIALQWFKSYMYIDDWTTKVEINGKSSQPSRSSIGLPQGSVFGPIGYTIYTLPVGDIARHHNIFYHTYADDIQLYITFDPKKAFSLDEALKALSSCVVDINTWMTHNRLKLNEKKD